jgi:hypothetical protein
MEKSGGLGSWISDSPRFSLKSVETMSERGQMRQTKIKKITKGTFGKKR